MQKKVLKMEHRDLNDLAVFAAIAQAGSITGAAKKMKLPKSNVSRRLSRLEDRLGVQLIERNTRSSRLTSIGIRYADYCRLMVEEANAADAVVETSLGEPAGELRVSASVLVGQQIIAPAIAAYGQQFPKVQVILELTNMRANLIEDGFDLAFRIGEKPDSSMMSQAIGTFPFGLYASPGYLRSSGNPQLPRDLQRHRCLIMRSGFKTSRWKLQRDGEVIDFAANGDVVVNDFLTLRNLAIAGGGIAMLPAYAVHAECASGLLSAVLPNWSASSVPLSAIYPSRRGATLKQRAFIDHVRQAAENLA
ncbi:LysR family transcriptional regulator [Phaeobacter inhibens]|uniref:LysR family transcriptional regulator n=2 Tax=Phaeobacter inhibens TaxID=221822 RepID=UPI0021A3AE5C|nr:LysR family transcriptional regulator [Phaeobacter inhibens]UWR58313.1 LysR family transcriptional regulator [Phaeobacter inhibens]